MTRTVWKYTLDNSPLIVQIPRGAKMLSAATQPAPRTDDQPIHDNICVWALIDPEAEKVARTIAVIGTGHNAPDKIASAEFIGTVMLYGGSLVFHVFIEPEPAQ